MEREQEKRKGLNLMAKILMLVLLPLFVMLIFAILAIRSVGTNTASRMMQANLKAGKYSLDLLVEQMTQSGGDAEALFSSADALEAFQEETGLGVAFYYGGSCLISTLTDRNGANIAGTEMDAELFSRVKAGENVYFDHVVIEDVAYYGEYFPVLQPDGKVQTVVFIGEESSKVESVYRRLIVSNIIFMSCLFAVAFVAALILMVFLTKALKKVVVWLENVSKGKLEVEQNPKLLGRADEIGNVARSVQTLVMSFGDIIRNILNTSGSLADLSKQFAEKFDVITEAISNVDIAVDEIANGATSQAGETQNVNAKFLNIGNAIDATAGNVEVLSASSQKMKEYNQTVSETLGELERISKESQASVEQVQKQTNVTNHSAMEIRTATEMITDIASQTNLLSLNASIEAARAGDAGRGFAVVAEQIRVLADQSKDSAEKITAIISELISNSNTSVSIMNEMSEVIGRQNECLATTQKVFVSLNGEIDHVVQAIDGISGEVSQLDAIKNEAMSSLESLAAIAEENAASTEETAASMQELNEIITECKQRTDELSSMSDAMLESTGKVTLG